MPVHSAVRGDRLAMRLALAAVRDPRSVVELSVDNLDLTLRILRRMRLLGRLACQLQDLGLLKDLPVVVRDQMQSAIALSGARARLLRWELQQLSRFLEPAKYGSVVVLKGAAYLALGLPNARGRLPTDVDLLVSEDDLRAHEQRLLEAGWRSVDLSPYDERFYREWTHEIPPLRHPEREMEVDLHFNIMQRTARLRPDPGRLLQRARPLGNGLMVLAPIDMVLHAMTHLFASSEPEDALRELVDIVGLLEHFGATEHGFWDELPVRARELDLLRPAFYALRYGERLLGFVAPAGVRAQLAGAGPGGLALRTMDWCLPRALVVQHPDGPGTAGAVARMLMLARAHWIRMPPLLLSRHLLRKTIVRMRSRPVTP
jgi:hypothetical protein